MTPKPKPQPFGLGWPNVISITRILAVPFLVWLMVLPGSGAAWGAFVLFTVGAATDKLDGYLARRYDVLTVTGAWLDPLADKLFVLTPIVVMALQDRFPWWAAAIMIVREAAVSLYRWRLDKQGLSMPASPAGKAKTVVQLIAIGAYLLPGFSPELRFALLLAAVAITLYSGVEYFVNGQKIAHAAGTDASAVEQEGA